MQIANYTSKDEQDVINLILPIQQIEFGVPVTINDQPDLLDVANVYCKGKGNFWVARENGNLVGTIALIDFGNKKAALRKMFVHKDYRGKDKAVAQALLKILLSWCRKHGISEIYLGTVEQLHAAKRFYEKNGFVRIAKTELPDDFPLMKVDTEFFKLKIAE
ncbi:MAG: GNAT family N-acetyltransferase [Chitinophagaceae bacterium]|nr:GNAT family N-acetyltransferase [Chitinophagaceae bacterium]